MILPSTDPLAGIDPDVLRAMRTLAEEMLNPLPDPIDQLKRAVSLALIEAGANLETGIKATLQIEGVGTMALEIAAPANRAERRKDEALARVAPEGHG